MPLYIFGMTPLSCSISSITPIVTGDHDHRNTELLATGILGSLRYQYWLLKAMQAWQEKQAYPPCSADLPAAGSNRFSEELQKAGPVIWLFGATNWKKTFRLEIADAVPGEPQSCSARSHSKAPHQWQNVKLTFRNDRKSLIFEENGTTLEHELRSLMAFVHQYGWLGAAPQNGLGWVTVQWEGLERIALDKDNPVFAAKDILLNNKEAEQLRKTLQEYYRDKHSNPAAPPWKQGRYLHSLDHLDKQNPQIGYEIRRWLKDQIKPSFFFGNEKQAGFVHVTHPVVQQDGSWRLRLRFAVRPGENGGINPIANRSPAAWLNDCCKLLKPEKPS